jgi:uncharacterized Zn finger protein
MANSKTDRITRGYAVYQHGHVTLLEADIEHESYTFRVKGSNHEVYHVHYEEGSWLCECDDWRNRAPKDPGSFLCKHIDSCYFLLAELKGVGKQAALEFADKKVIA